MSDFVEMFILGVTMSYGPCVTFCSPIILTYIASTKKGWKEGLFAAILFSVSRLLGHAFLGGAAGLAGSALALVIHSWGVYIYVVGGLFVSIIGLLAVFGKNIGSACCKHTKKHFTIGAGWTVPAIMGLMAGVMPCLPLMGVVGYIALNAQSGYQGFLLGTAFGVGTLFSPVIPLGILSAVFPEKFFKGNRLQSIMTKACGVLLIVFGINLIFGKTLF